jgi:hypothetical protein
MKPVDTEYQIPDINFFLCFDIDPFQPMLELKMIFRTINMWTKP